MKSEQINELALALSAVQAKLEPVGKNKDNPFFKSKYADLSANWEACRDLLAANGLSIAQTTDTGEYGVELVTTLMHKSGQWIEGRYPITPKSNDPQGIGSAITYARRYTLAAIVGVSPEDDDGEGAMGRGRKDYKEDTELKLHLAKVSDDFAQPDHVEMGFDHAKGELAPVCQCGNNMMRSQYCTDEKVDYWYCNKKKGGCGKKRGKAA